MDSRQSSVSSSRNFFVVTTRLVVARVVDGLTLTKQHRSEDPSGPVAHLFSDCCDSTLLEIIMTSRIYFVLALCLMSCLQSAAFTVSPVSRHARVAGLTSPVAPSPTALFGKKAARAQGNERKNKSERVRKPKDDVLEVEAVVLESLPNAMFRCQIDGAPETQEPVLATISGKIRKNFVKILVGDKVLIELSPYDLTRGRITFRYR